MDISEYRAQLERDVALAATVALTGEQITAASQLRVRRALEHIQRAQDEIGRAREMLSALNGGTRPWNKAGRLYDQIHSFWYEIERFKARGKYQLDSTNIHALKLALAKQQAGQ